MRATCSTLALAGALSLITSATAHAQSPLTLHEALARAREQAPRIVAARLAIDEARGRLAGANLRLQSNPELETAFGSRQGVAGRSFDIDAAISQSFEPSSRRTARIDGANAAVDLHTAQYNDTVRLVLADVTSAFLRAVHANERLRLLEATSTVASSIADISDRRFKAGDVAVLDVNLARAALARVRAEQEVAKASKAAALGELTVLLRFEAEPEVSGSLAESAPLNVALLEDLIARRPEILELEAALRAAEADVRLGASFGRPDYGLSFRYEREEQSNVLLGGISLTLPAFAKGQELRASGNARAQRLRYELEAARSRIGLEVRAALRVYERRLEAVRILEKEALPGLDENDTLANRSFEVGQIGLTDLLLIRREILETRFQYLDALLDAALARAEVETRAGVLK